MQPIDRPRIRILIVDDHEVVRIGLGTLLARYPQFQIAGEAGSVATAVEAATRLKPDVVLLDVRLPDGSGFDACRQMQRLEPSPKVLVLTSVANDDTVFEAIAAGAEGFLMKEVNGAVLVDALERVASGQSILDPSVTHLVLSRVKSAGEHAAPDKLERLSPQERRVLTLVADGKTNKEIGLEMGLSDKTVKNYLSNLLDKLQLSRRSQAAAFYAQHATR